VKPKNILLYIDASKESRAALDVAVDYSGLGSTIIAVNVVNRQTVIQLTRSGGKSLAYVFKNARFNHFRVGGTLDDFHQSGKAFG